MSENQENKNTSTENSVDIDTLSTILLNEDLESTSTAKSEEKVYDINIKNFDDIVDLLGKYQYDFVVFEPLENEVKISFKKDGLIRDEKQVKYPVYLQILAFVKKLVGISAEITQEEQKGTGIYNFMWVELDIISKTTPGKYGELLFVKMRLSQAKTSPENQAQTQKKTNTMTPAKAFWFFWAILGTAFVLWAAFISFIILNANSPQDVAFFTNLGISLNDINRFLWKITTIVFSVLTLVETIILIIFLFKAFLTKKEFKRKKTTWTILSIFVLILTFLTGTLWIKLDKSIKNLPNWQELSYGDIQIFDNDLLTSDKFDKESSQIADYNNIIGPINLKFDVKVLKDSEAKKGFTIDKYIWDFWGGDRVETTSSEIIKSFNKKGITTVKLTLEGIDSRTNKIVQKPSAPIPSFNINYIVDVKEKELSNGGKIYEFNASTLKDLGEVEWYLESNTEVPVFVGNIFKPSKAYFDKELIGMKIKNPNKKANAMDKIFIVSGQESVIKWEIDAQQSPDNPLTYTLKIKNLSNNFGNGFIEKFVWNAGGQEFNKTADLTNIEESSTITVNFPSYGKNLLKVTLIDSNGKSSQLTKEITIAQALRIENKLDIVQDGNPIDNDNFDEKSLDYRIEVAAPGKVSFDARKIRTQNVLYKLDSVKWDVGNDGSYEGNQPTFDHTFEVAGNEVVIAEYHFVHRKDPTDISVIKSLITVNAVEKDAQLSLEITPSSEYAPAMVQFDASKSKVKDDNIVKFIYDYGDGMIEERDAKNPGHRYLKTGNYKVKLKVVTQNGKEYEISKPLILKEKPTSVEITSSMKKSPVWQEISFYSTSSEGQISAYNWDFWDGSTSNEPNPTHAYSTPWTYKVKLSVDFTNNNSLSDDLEVEITE